MATLVGLLLLVVLVGACARLVGQLRRPPGTPLRGPLPEGHRPPAGLPPLSPSERFLRAEAERGIRALQLWLLDQDGAAA